MSKSSEAPKSAATRGMPSEPPGWWKRWRPLRWLAAILVLAFLSWVVRGWWPSPSSPPAASAAADPVPAVAAPAPAPAADPAADSVASAAAPATADVPAAAPAPDAAEIEEPITTDALRSAFTASVPPAQRLNFLAPFRSYASVDEIYRELEKGAYDPQLTSRHVRVPEGIPPSDLDIIDVLHYRHLGEPGKLQLQFFNDRLYQAEFEPDDADAYRPLFRRQFPQLVRERGGRAEFQSGALRIASSLDLSTSQVGQILHTRPFVLWQDLRLIRQRDDWDYQFARDVAP